MAETYCKTCRFFQGESLGVCLRYPEQIGKAEHQWCGEYVAKAQQIKPPIYEVTESLTVSAEPKRRGRPKKGENDVQTTA